MVGHTFAKVVQANYTTKSDEYGSDLGGDHK